MWSNLASDVPGVLLFLLWLLLPPLYVVVLGRRYAEQCAQSAHEAIWAREELRQAVEDLEAARRSERLVEDVPQVPSAREPDDVDTCEFDTVATNRPGRHRLHTDRSIPLARASA